MAKNVLGRGWAAGPTAWQKAFASPDCTAEPDETQPVNAATDRTSPSATGMDRRTMRQVSPGLAGGAYYGIGAGPGAGVNIS